MCKSLVPQRPQRQNEEEALKSDMWGTFSLFWVPLFELSVMSYFVLLACFKVTTPWGRFYMKENASKVWTLNKSSPCTLPVRSPYAPRTLPVRSPYAPRTLPVRSPYAPRTLPVRSPYAPRTLPVRSPYAPRTLPVRSPYAPRTLPVRSPYAPRTLPVYKCKTASWYI